MRYRSSYGEEDRFGGCLRMGYDADRDLGDSYYILLHRSALYRVHTFNLRERNLLEFIAVLSSFRSGPSIVDVRNYAALDISWR